MRRESEGVGIFNFFIKEKEVNILVWNYVTTFIYFLPPLEIALLAVGLDAVFFFTKFCELFLKAFLGYRISTGIA